MTTLDQLKTTFDRIEQRMDEEMAALVASARRLCEDSIEEFSAMAATETNWYAREMLLEAVDTFRAGLAESEGAGEGT
jgi:3-oxoacyl-(acyl-carrier-protein) synthase